MLFFDKIRNQFNQESLYSPYILLTTYCNQKCSYCFAQREMQKMGTKEMRLRDFKKLVRILKREKVKTLKLLGGEPTLHSQFPKIIDIIARDFSSLLIFSNGIIPEKSRRALIRYANPIEIWFNIDTPGFRNNTRIKKKVLETINDFSNRKNFEVILAFTVNDLKKDYISYFRKLDNHLIRRVGVRIGIANPLYGVKHFLKKKDFPKVGKSIIEIVEHLSSRKVKRFIFDCGFSPAMFTKEQKAFLIKNQIDILWGCEGKKGLDISVDLSFFPCYPYHQNLRIGPSAIDEISKWQKSILVNKISCCERKGN